MRMSGRSGRRCRRSRSARMTPSPSGSDRSSSRQVGHVPVGDFQRFGDAVALHDGVSVALQDADEHVEQRRVVINDEDGQRAFGRSHGGTPRGPVRDGQGVGSMYRRPCTPDAEQRKGSRRAENRVFWQVFADAMRRKSWRGQRIVQNVVRGLVARKPRRGERRGLFPAVGPYPIRLGAMLPKTAGTSPAARRRCANNGTPPAPGRPDRTASRGNPESG